MVTPETRDVYMDRLERETSRLEQIVEGLLYLSRMEQGQIPLNITPVDVNALVEHYATDRVPLAESKGLTTAVGFQRRYRRRVIDTQIERWLGPVNAPASIIFKGRGVKYTDHDWPVRVSGTVNRLWHISQLNMGKGPLILESSACCLNSVTHVATFYAGRPAFYASLSA